MAIKINDGLRTSILTGILGTLGTGMVLRLFGGVQPSTSGGANTAATIAQFSIIAFNAATNGTSALTNTTAGSTNTTGTITWGRLSDSSGTAVMIDGAAGTSGTCDFIINTAIFGTAGTVTLMSATFIQPSS